MPARLPPSLPVLQRASSSPEDMFVTETSRLVPKTRLLHPTLPYMIDPPNPKNRREVGFSASERALPPLQTRQLGDSSLALFPAHDGRQDPPMSMSRTLLHSHHSASFSPTPTMSLEQYAGNANQRRPDFGSPPPRLFIKPDDSEDMPFHSETLAALPSSSYKQSSPNEAMHGNLEIAHQQKLLDPSPRGDACRKIGISSLINNNNNNNESSSSLLYDIIIRQQPIAARACGFGDRDRRVVDPPPILQMIVRDPKATSAEFDIKIRYPFSVIHCELWNAELDHEETAMPEIGDRPPQRRLMGTLVASTFVARDENGVEGCFFPFPDLSCRTPGRYRLKFVLVVLDPKRMKTGDKLPFKAIVLSDVFEVYPAKTFPGMIPSSELTKRLKEQGCLISIKKGHPRVEMTIEGRQIEKNEEECDSDDADGPERGHEKRRKS